MLQIDQIKALLADHLMVYRGEPGSAFYRTVWLEGPDSFEDKQARLMYAHPADVVGIDWINVETPVFDPTQYHLHSENFHYGGHFHNINCFEEEVVVVTKVVKFDNPREPGPTERKLPHYVVFRHHEPLTDEEACERAIDLVLMLGAGFTEDNAKPVLVI